MAILPEVKCRRCGESFSALRSRCPNCGTRRVSQSTRTPSTTPSTVQGTEASSRAAANSRWQLLFGLVLVVAVILSVVVMVSTGLTAQDAASNPRTSLTLPVASESAQLVESAPTPTPTPTPSVENVKVYFYTNDLTDSDFTMRLSQGEDGDITLRAQAYPLTVENPTYKWTVDTEGIIEITPNADGSECEIHQVGVLQTGVVITIECYGVSCTVRCHAFE